MGESGFRDPAQCDGGNHGAGHWRTDQTGWVCTAPNEQDKFVGMKLYIFRSGREPDMFGFAADEEGLHLPMYLAPWSRTNEDPVEPPLVHSRFVNTEPFVPILAAVMDKGFYTARDDILKCMVGHSMAR